MRFTSTRKAIKEVRSGNLKSDLETLVGGIEKIARDNTNMASTFDAIKFGKDVVGDPVLYRRVIL